jgi:GntR family transcriptional regulator
MKLNRKLHIPLYIQLKDQILVAIKSNQYEIGDVIPSEQDMMKTYHVGRATVREAINELVKEGFLEKRQGKGTYIRRKNTSIGFEPLISLSYALGIRGWQHHNDVLDSHMMTNSEAIQALSLVESNEIFFIERNRFIDSHPLGLERFYFHSDFKEMAKDMPLEQSIGKLILETLKLPLERMVQEVVVVKVDEREATLLKLPPESDVMFMKRWLYIQGYEGAFQYYEFKVPVGVSAFPTEFL